MTRTRRVRCDGCRITSPPVPNPDQLARIHDHNMHGGRKTAHVTN